jgi:ABC-type antimicrobial peptide transport system permease subunit
VLADVVLTLSIGMSLGILISVFAGRLVTKLLYGLQAGDPTMLAACAMALALAAMTAGYLPARRASRLDPMTALRDE